MISSGYELGEDSEQDVTNGKMLTTVATKRLSTRILSNPCMYVSHYSALQPYSI